MDAQLQADLNAIISRLRKLEPTLQSGPVKRNLAEAAKPLLQAIKAATPVGTKEHSRYSRGVKVATYKPGNLKRSMQTLRFRRATNAVFVGPKLGGARADGYYAHIVEGRRPFFAPVVNAMAPAVLKAAIELFKRDVDNFGQRNGFK